jgi:hypothetical protein
VNAPTGQEAHRLTLCGSFGWGHAREAALATSLLDLAALESHEVKLSLLGGKKAGGLEGIIGLGEEDSDRRAALRGQPILICGHGVVEPSANSLILRCSSYLKSSFAPWSALYGASVESGLSYPWIVRRRLRAILRRMRRLFVADMDSEHLLQAIVGHRDVRVIGDPCLSLHAEGEVAPEVSHLSRYVVIALSPRWTGSADWHRFIVRRLMEISERLEATLVFVPTSIAREDDRSEADIVSRELVRQDGGVRFVCINRLLPPREMATTFGKSVLVLSMRLHPCVIAYGQRTPFVAILQHPKLHSLVRTIGCRQNLYPPVDIEPKESQAFGYQFKDLPMADGSLTQAALNAVRKTSFSALDKFQALQRAALSELLG